MSRSAKTAAALKRKAAKRTQKASQKLIYESYRDAGKNRKSKRTILAGRKAGQLRTVRHKFGPCGNIGCETCNSKATEWNARGSVVNDASEWYMTTRKAA